MKQYLKTMVRGCYTVQKLRIQTGNRLVANFRAKLGLDPSQKEDELDKEGKRIMEDIRAAFRKITDGVLSLPNRKKFKAEGVISSYTEFALISQYIGLEESEKRHFKQLEGILAEFPLWTKYLESVKGVGPAMAGVIISEIDIEKAEYPS